MADDHLPRWAGVNHLALVTDNMDETVRFYHGVLGMPLVGTISAGRMRHYFFRIGPQSTVAFFQWDGDEVGRFAKPAGVPFTFPAQFDHVSFTLPDEAALEALRARLTDYGTEITDVVDHGFMRSVYFHDNNGIALEASWWVRDPTVDGISTRRRPAVRRSRPGPRRAGVGRAGRADVGPGHAPGSRPGRRSGMTVIKINAITVPADSGDELAQRFALAPARSTTRTASRASSCLQPTDDRTTWLVVTRWRDDDAFHGVGEQSGLRPRPSGPGGRGRRARPRRPWRPRPRRWPGPGRRELGTMVLSRWPRSERAKEAST